MKRTVAYVLTSLLTFNCGLTTESLFTRHPPPTEKPASRPDVPIIPVTPAPTDTEIPVPVPDIVFGGGRLKLVPEEAQWLIKEGLVPGGEHAVEIPFTDLKSILSARTLSILRI